MSTLDRAAQQLINRNTYKHHKTRQLQVVHACLWEDTRAMFHKLTASAQSCKLNTSKQKNVDVTQRCRAASRARHLEPVLAMSTTHGEVTTHQDVVIFTTFGCPYCRKAKETLSSLNTTYKEVDVSSSSLLRTALRDVTGQRTVPQVFVKGSLVGGSDALAAKISDGTFQQLLTQPSSSAALPKILTDAMATEASSAQSTQAPSQQLSSDLLQLAAGLKDPDTGVQRQRRSPRSPPSFTGRDLIEWMQKHSSSSSTDRQAALAKAQQLLDSNLITMLSAKQPAAEDVVVQDHSDCLYALRSEAVGAVPWGQALNTHYWWGPAPARPAEVVAEDLRGRILKLYDKHLSSDGRSVSYKALKADPQFWDYVNATAELQRVSLSGMTREALMCFAINLYNALVIHALVVHGPEQYNSTTGRLGFFQKAAKYNIGGYDYVLDDLENGILRGNRPAASTVGMLLKVPQLSRGPFKSSDARAAHVVTPVDPRIHFALVCGAKSCPPIKLYSPDTLEEGLAAAAEAFIAADVEVDKQARKVRLSKIFSWYYPDFGANKAERLRFLFPYLPVTAKADLQQLLEADPAAHKIKVEHKPYDWSINAAAE